LATVASHFATLKVGNIFITSSSKMDHGCTILCDKYHGLVKTKARRSLYWNKETICNKCKVKPQMKINWT